MRPGFYRSLPADEYHNDPCDEPSLNYSTAKEMILQSDWHAWKQHPKLGGEPFDATKNMDEGSIVHAMLLGQSLDGMLEIIDASDYRKKDTKAQRDAAKDSGKLVILAKRYKELCDGLPEMRRNLADAGVGLTGHCEATVVWESGCLCRTRIDHISSDLCHIDDLKCTASANPKFLERQIYDMCYDVQAAAEIEAIETIRPELAGRVTFTDVFLETDPPFFVVAAEHSESMLMVGRARWDRAKKRWQSCLRSNIWRGFSNRIIAHAPNWAVTKELGEEL